jgi:VCBS repeat-containing protein
LGSGGSGDILVPNMSAGDYRLVMVVDRGISLFGSASFAVKSAEVIHLDQYLTDKVLAVEGNLFENDVFDVVNNLEALWISTDGGVNFTKVSASTTVQGEHGELVVESDGSYTYTPNGASEHFTAPVDDLFTYQVEFVDGATEQAHLTVTVTPSGAGMPDMGMNSAGFDFSNLETFAMDDSQDDEPLTLTLEDVLGTDDGEEFVTLPEPEEASAFVTASTDNYAIDTASFDVQPVVDPLDDLLDQHSLFI